MQTSYFATLCFLFPVCWWLFTFKYSSQWCLCKQYGLFGSPSSSFLKDLFEVTGRVAKLALYATILWTVSYFNSLLNFIWCVIITIVRTGKLSSVDKMMRRGYRMAVVHWPRPHIQPGSAYSHFLADSSFSIFCGSSQFENSCWLYARFGNFAFFSF